MILGIGLIAFLPLSWLGFSLPKAIFITLALGYFLLFFALNGGKIWCRKTAVWFVLGYFSLLLFFTIFSFSPLSSFFGVSGVQLGFQTPLLFGGGFLLSLMLCTEHLHRLLRILRWTHILAGGYALLQWLRLDPLASLWNNDAFLHRTFSFLGNPDWFAAFMILTMPLMFFENTSRPTFFQKFQHHRIWIVLLFEWLVLFSTASKAGFLGGMIGSTALLIQHFLKTKKSISTPKTIPIGKILAIVVILIVGSGLSLKIFYRDLSPLFRSAESRLILWQNTAHIIAQNPWGHGLDLFTFYYPHFATANLFEYESITTNIDFPHNQILQILFESGFIGLIVFYGLMIMLLKPHLRPSLQTKDEQQEKEERGFLFLISWSVIAYLVTNLFGFDTIASGFIMWLFLGLLVRSESPTKKGIKNGQQLLDLELPSRIALGLLGLMMLGLSYLNIVHFLADFSYEKGWRFLQTRDATRSIPLLEEAVHTYPYDRVYLLQASEALLALENSTPDQLQRIEQYLLQASKLSNGLDTEIPIFKAWLLAKEGQKIEAEKTFEQSFHEYPTKLRNYLVGFQIFTLLHEPQKIIELKNSLQQILPSYWDKPESEEGRIFQKNYPWVKKLLKS